MNPVIEKEVGEVILTKDINIMSVQENSVRWKVGPWWT